MYKGNSQSLQRAHGVHLIAPQKDSAGDDVLNDLAAMSQEELVAEQARLKFELARMENEISAAKRAGQVKLTHGLGHRKASIQNRLQPVTARIRLLVRMRTNDLWRQAVREICPDHAEAVEARFVELREEAA